MRRIAKTLAVAVLVVGLGGGVAWGVGDAKVNLNTADAAALESLPGIGPAKAAAVIEYREQVGSFQTVQDLVKVPGIGNHTLEQLESRTTVSGD